jgi:4-hydroxybenzoate polyprenyltransferase
MPAQLREHVAAGARIVRAVQWWDYKLVPVVSIFYATVFTQQVSLFAVWPTVVVLLVALAAAAAYVSLINDVTDRADDRRAGKSNRLADKPASLLALLLGLPLGVGALFALLWRDDPLLMASYLGVWVAFSLYSIPPFRLKARAALGLIADASGAHLFPTLVAALLALRAAGRGLDPTWLAACGAWAFACGLRGILWHQLYDLDNDRKAVVGTFAVRHSRKLAARLAAWVALPAEAIALAVLLVRIHSLWPALSLGLYAAFAMLRMRLWDVAVVAAEPRERYSLLGQEYYTLLFPLAILIASALRHPPDWVLVPVHLLLFPAAALSLARQVFGLARDLVHPSR